ncbi:MAG TPA: dipeptidase [Symbiobacteriaceae bacterium]|nr:dipeptidase [Symbiobacteriaceae bacterium]
MAQTWQSYLEEHQRRFMNEFIDLLRIPSISTDPAAKGEVRRAGEWTANRLRQAGLQNVAIMETGGHPAVYADWLGAPGQPTILFYGHFDVQPVDPIELWTTPPFEPVIRDGKLFARGATDMKGNDLLPIIACEAFLATLGRLPVNVKFLIEGEEEIGSPSLAAFIATHADLLRCDLVVSADGGVGDPEQPHLGRGGRGLCGLQIDVQTANVDMHSGTGGLTPNPIHALIRILDSLRSPDGTILVEGFYDEVRPMTESERATIAASPGDVNELLRDAGIKEAFGEPGFTPLERTASRPTLEVNGIWGGYQGEGIKTVIPKEAHAKITCRLVADQSPGAIRAKVAAHIQKQAPSYAAVTVQVLPGEADPYLMPENHPAYLVASRVLTGLLGKEPYPTWGGGTVPVMGMLKRQLGVETLTLGASGKGERAHAPDEFVRVAQWERMQRGFCLFMAEYAKGSGPLS